MRPPTEGTENAEDSGTCRLHGSRGRLPRTMQRDVLPKVLLNRFARGNHGWTRIDTDESVPM